ncbi:hypothetical protein GCM10027168_24970 [Streptomyces capparidis]
MMRAVVLLRPLPAGNARFACVTAVAYPHAGGEGVDAPYGAPVDLAREILDGRTDVHGAADRIRSRRIRPGRPAPGSRGPLPPTASGHLPLPAPPPPARPRAPPGPGGGRELSARDNAAAPDPHRPECRPPARPGRSAA